MCPSSWHYGSIDVSSQKPEGILDRSLSPRAHAHLVASLGRANTGHSSSSSSRVGGAVASHVVGLTASVAANDPGSAEESSATVSSNKSTTSRSSEASDPAGEGSTSGHGSSNATSDGVHDRRSELAVKSRSGSLGAAPGDVAKVAAGVALLSSSNSEAVVGAKGGAVDSEVTNSSVASRRGFSETAPSWRVANERNSPASEALLGLGGTGLGAGVALVLGRLAVVAEKGSNRSALGVGFGASSKAKDIPEPGGASTVLSNVRELSTPAHHPQLISSYSLSQRATARSPPPAALSCRMETRPHLKHPLRERGPDIYRTPSTALALCCSVGSCDAAEASGRKS
jgi:hypothetical protein